jgi:hypothetical protein
MQIRQDIAVAEMELEEAKKDQVHAKAVCQKMRQKFEAKQQLLDYWWSLHCTEVLVLRYHRDQRPEVVGGDVRWVSGIVSILIDVYQRGS